MAVPVCHPRTWEADAEVPSGVFEVMCSMCLFHSLASVALDLSCPFSFLCFPLASMVPFRPSPCHFCWQLKTISFFFCSQWSFSWTQVALEYLEQRHISLCSFLSWSFETLNTTQSWEEVCVCGIVDPWAASGHWHWNRRKHQAPASEASSSVCAVLVCMWLMSTVGTLPKARSWGLAVSRSTSSLASGGSGDWKWSVQFSLLYIQVAANRNTEPVKKTRQ